MKKVKLFLAALIVSIAVISCGGKKGAAADSAHPLEGKWKVAKAEGDYADMNKGTNYIFDGDKISLEAGIIKTPGTFRLSNDTIIVKFDGGQMEMNYTYKIEGEQLVVKPMGSNQVLYLDKD